MREDYRLLTPENVELRFAVAGVGSRLVAASIDYGILVSVEIVLLLAATFIGGAGSAIAAHMSVPVDDLKIVGGLAVLVLVLLLGLA